MTHEEVKALVEEMKSLGIADAAMDENGYVFGTIEANIENWSKEYSELLELLTPLEYESARASTLYAHYTSPTVVKAIYKAVENMGFEKGNVRHCHHSKYENL